MIEDFLTQFNSLYLHTSVVPTILGYSIFEILYLKNNFNNVNMFCNIILYSDIIYLTTII